jgi:hypothetical protein
MKKHGPSNKSRVAQSLGVEAFGAICPVFFVFYSAGVTHFFPSGPFLHKREFVAPQLQQKPGLDLDNHKSSFAALVTSSLEGGVILLASEIGGGNLLSRVPALYFTILQLFSSLFGTTVFGSLFLNVTRFSAFSFCRGRQH